jgi:microcystin degradation protein MlrC
MRIGVAGIVQESNTLAPFKSRMEDFTIYRGNEVISANEGTNTEVGGFLRQLDSLGVKAVPLISAWAVSAGPAEDSAFELLVDLLIERIKEAQCDGLLIALHGAWVTGAYSSADAELVRRVRSVIGPSIPIVITLDLHANVRPSILREIQGLVGFRTYPHIDMADTGMKAARLLYDIVTKGLKTRMYWMSIPLLAPPQAATTEEPPIGDVLERLDGLVPEGVLSASFFCVQPWLDMEDVMSCIVVVAESDNFGVPDRMRVIAGQLWDHRDELTVDWISPNELLAEVFRDESRPVIVSEAYDATTGGAPGDHPGLLSILLPHQKELSACLFMVDPQAVQIADELGVGREFRGALGAKIDTRYGAPLKGPVFTGRTVNMGRTAVLQVGELKIVVASKPTFNIDPELYRSQGIEPKEQDIIAVKSPSLFRPGYASMLGRVLHLDMPGVCRGNLRLIPFSNIGRPIWPLDDFDWDAASQPVLMFPQADAR